MSSFFSRFFPIFFFFFFNDTATTEIYTLSLHDALPISNPPNTVDLSTNSIIVKSGAKDFVPYQRSEEHTSELQSRLHLVCRLLLEKKKKKIKINKKIYKITRRISRTTGDIDNTVEIETV